MPRLAFQFVITNSIPNYLHLSTIQEYGHCPMKGLSDYCRASIFSATRYQPRNFYGQRPHLPSLENNELRYRPERWTPKIGPQSAENKIGSLGLLSFVFLFVCRSLCALKLLRFVFRSLCTLKLLRKERTSRAWHCPSSPFVFLGFPTLPPQSDGFQDFLTGSD